MPYVDPADFHTGSLKPWTEGLTLDESDGSETYLDSVIAKAQEWIDAELGDTFEPPSPDNPITVDLDVSVRSRTLDVGRRVRSLTSVQTQTATGAFITEPATLYRRISSGPPNPRDVIRVTDGLYLSTGAYWPVGLASVRLTGLFGYAATPEDIKRLTALWVYDYVRPRDDPFSEVAERTTVDGTVTYGDGERERIMARYRRIEVLAR